MQMNHHADGNKPNRLVLNLKAHLIPGILIIYSLQLIL